jgi:Predicted enzyme related to lactoylglutathione lyase
MKIIAQHTFISILVDDQEEALRFYTEKLGLEKREDILFTPALRLLTVAAYGQSRPVLALAKPDLAAYREEHIQQMQERSGQRVVSIFATRNCEQTYAELRQQGVTFVSTPTRQVYGVEALFTDLYGNVFSLLEVMPGMHHLCAQVLQHYRAHPAA